MAAVNPTGGLEYWEDGEPVPGLKPASVTNFNTELYWFNGEPDTSLYKTTVSTVAQKFFLFF